MFHNALPVNNNNKIPEALQAVCLKSQLYGRAKDLCSGVTVTQLVGENAVDLIVGHIYKRDALSVVSEAYKAFNLLLNTRRGTSESMKNFESRFSAQVANFNSISATTKLPECITALMLMSNSSTDDAQRVSVMAAASPSDGNLDAQSSNDEYLSAVTYNSVASVIKQCDKASQNSSRQASNTADTLHASGGNFNNRHNRNGGNRNYNESRQSRISPTMKFPYNTCGKYGHWKRNYLADGSLPTGVKSYDSPHGTKSTDQSDSRSSDTASGSGNSAGSSSYHDKKRTIRSSMATFTGSDKTPSHIGPLIDSGAPYSAIGLVELKMLADHYGFQMNPTVDPIPKSLDGYDHWQYGTGNHANLPRKILGSIAFTATTDTDNEILITHLVLAGSSQWVVGRNVTSKANIENITRNALVFMTDGGEDSISLVNRNFLSFIPM